MSAGDATNATGLPTVVMLTMPDPSSIANPLCRLGGVGTLVKFAALPVGYTAGPVVTWARLNTVGFGYIPPKSPPAGPVGAVSGDEMGTAGSCFLRSRWRRGEMGNMNYFSFEGYQDVVPMTVAVTVFEIRPSNPVAVTHFAE